MNTKRGVLFDMDGVVVLTEHLKAKAHAKAVEAFGGTVSAQFYAGIMGGSRSSVRAAFIKESGIDIDPDAYAKIYDQAFRESIFTEMQVAEGGRELLARLKETDYVLALVTSSIR
ncbi:MAG: HAD family hydrolase, partial [bacterium]